MALIMYINWLLPRPLRGISEQFNPPLPCPICLGSDSPIILFLQSVNTSRRLHSGGLARELISLSSHIVAPHPRSDRRRAAIATRTARRHAAHR